MTGEAARANSQTRLVAVAEATETMLDALLQPHGLPGEKTRPSRLLEAMRYASLGGGKRLRPFLLVETARLFGLEGEGVLRAACALEMIHCYSLVHDDLPAMDDDDLRRGRPTAHKAFDEATAILAGDGLLTYAFDIVADAPTHADAAVRAELTVMLARAAGLGGMVGGQALDLEAEASKEPHTQGFVALMQAMKTGALLLYAVEAGAVMGGADAAQKAALFALRRSARRGFPGRRRHSRRRGRRAGAGQARRQGRRPQQGDAGRGAGPRGGAQKAATPWRRTPSRRWRTAALATGPRCWRRPRASPSARKS